MLVRDGELLKLAPAARRDRDIVTVGVDGRDCDLDGDDVRDGDRRVCKAVKVRDLVTPLVEELVGVAGDSLPVWHIGRYY